MEKQLKPLVVASATAMKLLSIGRSTLDYWLAIGRLNDLKLHRRKKTFAYAEIEQLAKLPPKQQPQQKNKL